MEKDFVICFFFIAVLISILAKQIYDVPFLCLYVYVSFLHFQLVGESVFTFSSYFTLSVNVLMCVRVCACACACARARACVCACVCVCVCVCVCGWGWVGVLSVCFGGRGGGCLWAYGVVVSMFDFHSSDRGSNHDRGGKIS